MRRGVRTRCGQKSITYINSLLFELDFAWMRARSCGFDRSDIFANGCGIAKPGGECWGRLGDDMVMAGNENEIFPMGWYVMESCNLCIIWTFRHRKSVACFKLNTW